MTGHTMPRRRGRRGWLFVVGTALIVGAGLSPAGADTGVPAGFTVSGRRVLHDGVEYFKMREPSVPETVDVAHVRPGAPVDLRVTNGNDRVFHSGRDRELPSSICQRVGCIAGVNGDFYQLPYGLSGGGVSGGRMLRSPSGRPQLTLTSDGRLSAGPLPWTGSLTASDGTTIELSGVNVPRPSNGVVLYTPAWGAATGTDGGTELIIGTSEPAGMLNRPATANLRATRSAGGPIPTDGAVLSATGRAARTLSDLWTRSQQRVLAPEARLLVASPLAAVESIGVSPVILRDGVQALPWPDDPNIVTRRHPRTLFGWNAAGDRFLIAVDGRQHDARGMTMAEAADLLLGLGATEGVNLDGGGGTTLVVEGSVLNHPSEGTERSTANALLLLPRSPTTAEAPTSGPSPGQVSAGPGSDGSASSDGNPDAARPGENGTSDVTGSDWLPTGQVAPTVATSRAPEAGESVAANGPAAREPARTEGNRSSGNEGPAQGEGGRDPGIVERLGGFMGGIPKPATRSGLAASRGLPVMLSLAIVVGHLGRRRRLLRSRPPATSCQ